MSQSVFIAGKAGEELTGLAKGLENYGYDVVVNEGENVLDSLFKGSAPSAIILDSMLKEVKTLEICREIKNNRRYAKVPLLIIKDKEFQNEEYLAMGVKDFIDRPVSPARIHESIGYLTPEKKQVLLSFKQKKIGVVIVLILFLAFLAYFIVFPMIVGSPAK